MDLSHLKFISYLSAVKALTFIFTRMKEKEKKKQFKKEEPSGSPKLSVSNLLSVDASFIQPFFLKVD